MSGPAGAAGGEQPSPAPPPVVTTRVTEYLVCVDLPEGHDLRHELGLQVAYRGQGMWAVKNRGGEVADAKGRWKWEPSPSNRSDAFLRRFRHTEADALALAQRLAPQVSAMGRTAAQWAAQANQSD